MLRKELSKGEKFGSFLSTMFGMISGMSPEDITEIFKGYEMVITDLIIAAKEAGGFTFELIAQRIPDCYIGDGERATLEWWFKLWRFFAFVTIHYKLRPLPGMPGSGSTAVVPGVEPQKKTQKESARQRIINELGGGTAQGALDRLEEIKGDHKWTEVPGLLAQDPYNIEITYGYLNSLMTGLRKVAKEEKEG